MSLCLIFSIYLYLYVVYPMVRLYKLMKYLQKFFLILGLQGINFQPLNCYKSKKWYKNWHLSDLLLWIPFLFLWTFVFIRIFSDGDSTLPPAPCNLPDLSFPPSLLQVPTGLSPLPLPLPPSFPPLFHNCVGVGPRTLLQVQIYTQIYMENIYTHTHIH